MIGTEESRLIILRGNSASGKSTLARAIRAARPRGIAVVGLDQLRRDILHVHDRPGALSVDLMDLTARFALDRGLHVVVEGILHAEIYGDMLSRLVAEHRGVSRCYRYDLSLEETLRRHRSKPLAAEVSEEQVTSWYRELDAAPALEETVLDASMTLEQALDLVLVDAGWERADRAPRSGPG